MDETLLDAALLEVQAALDDGNGYGALQLFHSRFIRLRRQTDGALAAEFGVQCAQTLGKSGDSAAAADVLRHVLSVAGEEVPPASPAPHSAVPLDVPAVLSATETISDAEKALEVLKSLLKVAGKLGVLSDSTRAELHRSMGGRYRALDDLANSLRHLRRGADARAHVEVLRQLCAEGYASEEGLFVCREVLHTLLEASPASAQCLLHSWGAQSLNGVGNWEKSPAVNLCELMVEIVESDAGVQLRRRGFELVLHVYAPVLERDEGLRRLLLRLGEKNDLVEKSESKAPTLASLLGDVLRV